jgi:uncharacterized protein (DUF2237 family)
MLRFLILALLACASHARYLNVHGGALQKCSQHGMALTGFSRTGECYAHDDDQVSHHVCIDLSSTTGGNFCAVTVRPAHPASRPKLLVLTVRLQGQPNWCSSRMQCDGSPSQLCPVKQWCVCQWAFASYVDRAGGCVRSCMRARGSVAGSRAAFITLEQVRPHPERGVRSDQLAGAEGVRDMPFPQCKLVTL